MRRRRCLKVRNLYKYSKSKYYAGPDCEGNNTKKGEASEYLGKAHLEREIYYTFT